jgi:TonB family protein
MRADEFITEAKATKTRLDPKCWKGKKIGNPKTKVKGGVRVNNCVPAESVELDEISRRDFLRGAGAALGSVVLGAPKGAFGQETPGSYGPTQVDVSKLMVTFQPDADAYYPSFSKRAGEQGTVVVRLTIDETGNVEGVQLLLSSKFPRLDRAAIEIGKRYQFKPYLINGVPTKISTNLLMKFNLKDSDNNPQGQTANTPGQVQPGYSWTEAVTRKVKPLIVFNPATVDGNPAVTIGVELAPDGDITSTKILQSSGVREWDRAVLLALARAESLPKDANGKIPRQEVKLTFRPKELQESEEELAEEFDLIESNIDMLAERNGVDAEAIWEDLESLTDDELYVFAVTQPVMEDWQKANKKDRTAGMSQKAVNAYRRENPGSKLKTAVTTKPSKLKKGSKASKRRKSYCSRSRGQMKMHNISCAKTPDKAICKARRRWNCE